MSEQTWTDEQFAEFLTKLDSMNDGELAQIKWRNEPGQLERSERKITLIYQEQEIVLSPVQVEAAREWENKRFPPDPPITTIGDFTLRMVNGILEIRGRTYEYVEMPAKDALDLLRYLYAHKDELEALAKEQA